MDGIGAYGGRRDAATGSASEERSPDSLMRYRDAIRVCLTAGLAAVDLLAIAGGCLAGAALRHGSPFDGNVGIFFFLAPTYLLAAIALRAYSIGAATSPSRAISATFTALLIAAGLFLTALFALKVGSLLSRLEIGYSFVTAFALIGLGRIGAILLTQKLLAPIVAPRLVVFTDDTERGALPNDALTTYVDVRAARLVPHVHDPDFFAAVSDVIGYADRVVLAFADAQERLKWTEAMRLSGFEAEIVFDLGGFEPLALSRWSERTTLIISRGPLTLAERLTKRLFDLVVTLPLIVAVAPTIALVALLVKLDSPGPAFFVQERVGRNNRSYRCFKLRTMRSEASDATGRVSTSRNDRRVTRVGRFLRRTSLDELPQLLNVLIGNMSLVGPRPHALGSRAEGALFWELVPDYWSRHSVKPGLTGLAQIRGLRGATHSRRDIEARVASDLEYINNWSLWMDVKVLLLTVRVIIHRNAH
ncbi:exopolysaccharide biosynthesis polyprenyl glycosylphosphotransferase [Ancylobacter sp. FA202]|uniref:exopolysaccharide biosynthesis polyprenyl glycosylphosphotransferase n=1 Tax=Ancylobacter sp. FA202 TaxID=1111106 RepID=UPI00037DBBBE|nr:exopolysaccharide biosynthesis polyprenyl glycosylphosphotransferase [Ancylobacter sp. FA202]